MAFNRTFIHLLKPLLLSLSKSLNKVLFPVFLMNFYLNTPKLSLETPVHTGTPSILLKKKDYFNKIIGNSKDFFFFIVFQEESQETFSEAQQIVSTLSKSLSKYTPNSNISIYLIERAVYRDIKATINRVKTSEIYEKDTRNTPIEIYFKTPYASTQAFIKYRQGSFFNERTQKKLFKFIRKLLSPVDFIEDPTELLQVLHRQSLDKINSPVIIRTMGEGGSNEKNIRKFKKTVFACLERKLLPLNTRFVILSKSSLLYQFGLLGQETYILRNDFLGRAGFDDPKDTNGVVIDFQSKGTRFQLEKYSVFRKTFMETEETLLRECKTEKIRENTVFLGFVAPRVFYLSDSKTKSLAPLFKRVNMNRKKPILSLFLTNEDVENPQRIEILKKLYEIYREKFYFLVMDSKNIEEVFPHANRHFPRFAIFNFFSQNKNSNIYRDYYKNLMHPYEKYFLYDNEAYFERFEAIKEGVEGFLGGRARMDYISKNDDLVAEINSDAFDRKIEQNERIVLELYENTTESEFSRQCFNKICEEEWGRVKCSRMNGLNESKYLVNLGGRVSYVVWDPVAKKMYVYQPDFGEIAWERKKMEENLRRFIKDRAPFE